MKLVKDSKVKYVNIMGLDYKIEYVDGLIENRGLSGQISYREQLIQIDNNVASEERKEITLLHEIIHGLLEEMGYFELTNNEHLINTLAYGLYMAQKSLK